MPISPGRGHKNRGANDEVVDRKIAAGMMQI